MCRRLRTRQTLRQSLFGFLFDGFLTNRGSRLGSLLTRLVARRIANLSCTTDTPRVVPTDPDDDHVIAAAVTGQADLIASGDKRDLLPLGSFQGIDIVTTRDALQRLGATGKT